MPGKIRSQLTLAMAIVSLAGAPALPGDEDPAAASADSEVVSWRERYLAIGHETYEWACAACHEEGKNGAPRKGDQTAWSDRSPLWSAVLLEHAKQGYLQMPAKGGHPYLSDRAVEAAGEYMLSETFPDLPRD